MLLLLAIVADGMRRLIEIRTNPSDEFLFEEEYPSEIVSLKPPDPNPHPDRTSARRKSTSHYLD